ncbi:MBL fold metallo-hydrolase [Roseibium litorale]|uniref:MBL fold metallo-hydrolase n=1 Tax=Roseibium litorale TaxID=2803841 RepID=A0ABR9CTH8_9HYPH|nr:MBL fold metallo-hydrolase [Roseibium litorale]MBD8893592.1 MBL fold metallo-hydrolase [Roseibium litorale]
MTTRRQALSLLAASAMLPLAPRIAFPAAAFSQVANSGFYRFMLGDLEITAISDGTMPLPLAKIYQDEAEDKLQQELDANFLGTKPHVSINAFLINDGKRLVLVDAGTGTLFGPVAGKLISHLANAGYQPPQIDAIVLTHIHADHSGGLTVDGIPQYPNADIHVAESEYDFWINRSARPKQLQELEADFTRLKASLDPYIKADRIRLFKENTPPLPGFDSIPRPGHTPGHSSIVISSKGQKLVIWGDIVHGDYIQFDDPDVYVTFDVDGHEAVKTRAIALEEAAEQKYLVAGAHIPFPGIGHVVRDETMYGFIPLNYAE